jgi:lipopolysaccharide transport system permease protein
MASLLEASGPREAAEFVTVITPPGRWPSLRLRELWAYRELLAFLMWRDIKVRYRQAVLGAFWAILQPLITMTILTLIFGWFAGLDQRVAGRPYSLFVLSGLLPWLFFAAVVSAATNSVFANGNLVTKVYFPRLLIPLATVGPALVDFGVSLLLLLTLMLFMGQAWGVGLLVMPASILLLTVLAAGVGSLLAALAVLYRDFRFLVPFLLQIWFYLTPIIYPVDIFPAECRWLFDLNPMTGLIAAFRATLFGGGGLSIPAMLVALAGVIFSLGGLVFFRGVEEQFTDVI